MKVIMVLLLIGYVCPATAVWAQEQINISITSKEDNKGLEFVTVSSNNKWLATSDANGKVRVGLPAGSQALHFSLTGYKQLDTIITVPGTNELAISMEPATELSEVTIVSSTRNGQSMESSPLKVEVLGLEEVNEEAGIKPGNIASILGDVSGVQIQQSSATSGNSNVRIQGLGGKYTQILRDGMPLYDGFSGGFGILTIPPLDLKQIELIKGSASTLYGGGAIGGLINLVSKRPDMEQQLDALINYTSLKEGNVNVYAAKRNKTWGYTLFAGYTNQQAVDVNKDGFSDLPDANSLLIHPKLFYYPSSRTVLSLGYSGSFDARKGGDMFVLNKTPDVTHQFYESNTSQRHTGEYMWEQYLKKDVKLTVKGNASNFNKTTASSTDSVQGNQLSYYNEVSVFVPFRKNNLVAGINVVGDQYRTISPDTALLKGFVNTTVGMFGQYSLQLKEHTTIETGLRFDMHTRYGLFVLPRIAVFHRFNEHWASRAGFGMGYKTPNPLVQQNTEYSITQMLPLSATVKPEISYGYNAELNYKKQWNEHSSLFINQAFFLTQVNAPVLFQQTLSGNTELVNAGAPIVSRGFDTYAKLDIKSWELYLGYTFTDARNTYLPVNTFIPLTPKNRWAFVLVKEIASAWRFGLEGSYTGSQFRYDATKTPSYMFIAAMVQRTIGRHIAVVLNCENLLDYRMSKVESLYTGTISAPAFKPLWAPIDGRVVNLSVRWKM